MIIDGDGKGKIFIRFTYKERIKLLFTGHKMLQLEKAKAFLDNMAFWIFELAKTLPDEHKGCHGGTTSHEIKD
jgi:hypothetical protein